MNEIITVNAETSIVETGINETLLNRWIAYIDAKPKTVQTYTRAIKQFYLYLQAEGIKNPTRDDIIAFRDKMAAEHKPATVNLYLMSVKQFYKWAAQEGICKNIAEHIKAKKLAEGHSKTYLTGTQAAKLINNIDRTTEAGRRDYAILSLMLTTGMRTIEVVRANIEDIETIEDNTVLYLQGKGYDDRTLYVKVTEPVQRALREYLACRKNAKQGEPLFTSVAHKNAGERMTTRSVSRICKDTMIDAGFNSSRLTAHSLRHTAATLNLLNGGTLEETQQFMRHKNINTTLVYVHSLNREDNKSEARITDAIFA